jgi:hypothetical protein
MFMNVGVNLDGDLKLRSRLLAREAAFAEALVRVERTAAFVPPRRMGDNGGDACFCLSWVLVGCCTRCVS